MIEMRLATTSDNEAIHEIFTHAAEFKYRFDDTSWRDGFSSKGVAWMIDQRTTYVAIDNAIIVGTAALEWVDDGWGELDANDAGYIRRLAVAENKHGKGIAKYILDWAMQEVTAKERAYLRLDCSASNTSLCKYYENQGFVLINTVTWPSDSGKETKANLYQKEV